MIHSPALEFNFHEISASSWCCLQVRIPCLKGLDLFIPESPSSNAKARNTMMFFENSSVTSNSEGPRSFVNCVTGILNYVILTELKLKAHHSWNSWKQWWERGNTFTTKGIFQLILERISLQFSIAVQTQRARFWGNVNNKQRIVIRSDYKTLCGGNEEEAKAIADRCLMGTSQFFPAQVLGYLPRKSISL